MPAGHVRAGWALSARPRQERRSERGDPRRCGGSIIAGRTTGVTLETGSGSSAPSSSSGAHPRITVLDLVGAEHFAEVFDDMRRYRAVAAVRRPTCPLRAAVMGRREPAEHRRRDLPFTRPPRARLWQDAVRGEPAECPYLEVEPTSVDPSLTDDGTSVMTMFTQYGPHSTRTGPVRARRTPGAASTSWPARAEREGGRIHHEVLAPPDLERIFGLAGGSIFQGEQGLDQMAFSAHPRSWPSTPRLSTASTCAAPAHPGGGVMGACGHNAAQRVLRDRTRRSLSRSCLSPLDDAEERRSGIGL